MSAPMQYPYPAHELNALRFAGRRRWPRRFARMLLFGLVVAPFVLAFTPWQQNMHGEGRVIEFNPVDRPMPMQARVDGLLMKWHVREGQQVKVGDPIVDLADNDPRVLERLQEQLDAAEQKRRAREREEYDYQFKREQQLAREKFEDEFIAMAFPQ